MSSIIISTFLGERPPRWSLRRAERADKFLSAWQLVASMPRCSLANSPMCGQRAGVMTSSVLASTPSVDWVFHDFSIRQSRASCQQELFYLELAPAAAAAAVAPATLAPFHVVMGLVGLLLLLVVGLHEHLTVGSRTGPSQSNEAEEECGCWWEGSTTTEMQIKKKATKKTKTKHTSYLVLCIMYQVLYIIYIIYYIFILLLLYIHAGSYCVYC